MILLIALVLLMGSPARAQSVSFVGAGAQTTTTSGTITPTIPAGTAAGDFAVLILAGRPNNNSVPSAPTGWTLRNSLDLSGPDVAIVTLYRVLAGGDANPAVDLPGGWLGSSAGTSGQIAVWRGVDSATPFDVADATATGSAAALWVPPALTTVTNGAWVVSAVATNDDNDVRFSAAAGFSARMSGTAYNTTDGADHSMALGDKAQPTAGLASMPTWQQNANGADSWAGITFALRPAGASSAKFTINHNGFGINCVAQTITVNVVDSVAGTPLLNYNAQVQLDTQSGYGTWALVTGTGAFSDGTANDGVATYNWPLGQSSATFTLYYPQGPPSIDVDVFQVGSTGIRDTDAEGPLVFSPNGFTVTAAALSNPPPGAITTFVTNETAGTDFPLYLTAYGQTPTDATCGVIEAYTGTKSVKFWSTYMNPASGTRNVTIDTVSAATTEGASAAQNVTFTNGQAVVTAKYKDVGRINIGMKDDTTNPGLPNGIRGGTANFVVKPYDFVLSSVQNAAGTVTNPQAATAAGTVFIAAGAPFRATVTVRDAEGSTTPNYGRETPAESVRLVPTLFLPAGGANPAFGMTTGFGAFTNGVATGTDFTWSEVGIVQARGGIADADYLGAGDVAGASLNERIGRFVPSRFVAALNSPLLNTGCTAGSFTYQGQSFGYSTVPILTATAVSVSGSTTTNYTGAFFKLTNSTLTGRTYTSAAGTLDTTGLPATTTDPVIASSSGGVATLTFSSGTGLNFTRTLLAPFNAGIQLAINVLDSDGVAAVGSAPLGNPVTFGVSTGIPFTAGQEIRYGRIRVGTAIGSERVNLPVPMRAEYYAGAGSGFVTNTNDTCTTGATLAFSNYTDGLSAGETCVSDTGSPGSSGMGCAAAAPLGEQFRQPPTVAAGGDFNLRLQAPGVGNQGSVVITATVPSWLRYDWNTTTPGDENPIGQATFGIFSGEQRQIYTREIY